MSDDLSQSPSQPSLSANELALQLSPTQQAALRQLGEGCNMAEAARSAGVDRRTLYNWIHQDPQFGAAYNAWQREVLESGHARALTLTDKALTTVDAAIEKGNVSAALQVIRHLGVLRPVKPGPTDAKLLNRQRKLAARRRDLRHKRQNADNAKEVAQILHDIRHTQATYDFWTCNELMRWFYYERERALAREARQLGKTSDQMRTEYAEDDNTFVVVPPLPYTPHPGPAGPNVPQAEPKRTDG